MPRIQIEAKFDVSCRGLTFDKQTKQPTGVTNQELFRKENKTLHPKDQEEIEEWTVDMLDQYLTVVYKFKYKTDAQIEALKVKLAEAAA